MSILFLLDVHHRRIVVYPHQILHQLLLMQMYLFYVGVVLGNIAELNLARAMAITTDLTLFVTRPWALFFLIIAIFSSAFPIYQVYRGAKKWTMFYLPVACFAVSGPLFMMGGVPRTTLAAVVVLFGAYTLWRRQQAGWVFERDEEEIDEPQISEGK